MEEQHEQQRLKALAEQVASEYGEAEQATRQAEESAAAYLEQVIQIVKFALKAIGTRPAISRQVRNYADINGSDDDEALYDYRCVCLSSTSAGPYENNPRQNQGSYRGVDLLLREDGKMIQMTYEGGWSRWQGSSWGWEAVIVEYVTPMEAFADGWGWQDVDEWIARLANDLEASVGERKDTAKRNLERAERLQACTTLLKK